MHSPALSLVLVQNNLPQTHEVRSHLHQLVLLDILQSLLEGELDGRRQHHLLVGAGCPHIGQFLGLADVDGQIARPGVLADHLTGIDLLARIDEEAAAVLELIHGVSH